MQIRLLFIALVSLFWLQGVNPNASGDTLNSFAAPPLPTMSVSFGRSTLDVEIASTATQRQTGLMNRTQLAKNGGMIFLMPRVGPASFWMKDTLIPLSIAYLDRNGTILEIEDKKPLDATITHTKSDKVAYVLEANLHWFAVHQVEPGDKVSPPPDTWGVTAVP